MVMDTNGLDTFCGALLQEAERRYADDVLQCALAKSAIEAYRLAYATYLKAAASTISSYSVNGRSVSRTAADSTLWREAYRRLLQFFPQLPAEQGAAAQYTAVDFSGVQL